MHTATIPALTGAKVRRDEIRSPAHRFMVDVSGRPIEAWLLKSIDSNHTAERDTLVIPNPNEILAYLSPAVQEKWVQFQTGLDRLRKEWHFHGLPTLKRVVRLTRNGRMFRHLDVATVVHHHGAVPVFVAGRIDDFQVALYPEEFGREVVRGRSVDAEVWEVLQSLSEFLPLMLQAYYEQIAFYLESIFFTASDEQVMGFCQRIREISKRSMVQKLDMLERVRPGLNRSRALASEISKKFEKEIREARAVDAFAHLLVNYIYRFFCISDRIADYSKRLEEIPSRKNLFGVDSIGFMQECARNMERLDDTFLGKLERRTDNRADWLQKMGQVSALVAEIVKSTDGVPIERPKLFITHHFKVDDSEKFIPFLRDVLQRNNINVEIVQGRHLNRDIRWSILARIWMCDHHILFLPGSWIRDGGKPKILRRENSWVVMELLYGNLLHRDLTLVAKAPCSEQVLDDFRKQVSEYTSAKEIPIVPEDGWPKVAEKSKIQIAHVLHEQKRLDCDLDGADGGRFDESFVREILRPTRRRLLTVFFDAWRSFFDVERWSIVQALVEMNRKSKAKTCTVRELAEFMRTNVAGRANFSWVSRYATSLDLEDAIRDNHLGRPDDFGTLRQFSFRIGGQSVAPLIAEKEGRRLRISLRIEETYQLFCESLQVAKADQDFEEIIQVLIR
jgi:hypothetical protein